MKFDALTPASYIQSCPAMPITATLKRNMDSKFRGKAW